MGNYERPAIATRHPVCIQLLSRRYAMVGTRFGKDPRCYYFAGADAVVLPRDVLVVWKRTERSAANWSSFPYEDRYV